MTRSSHIPPLLGLALALITPACGSSSDESTSGALTYSADVAPLLQDKCARCHQPGGIAPFSVLDYATVSTKAPLIAAMTKTHQMPPFQVTHDGTCGQFEDADALTDTQIDLLQRWVAQGAKQGEKTTLTAPRRPSLDQGTDIQTPMVTPMAAGNTLAQFDDYRCFIVDPKLPRDQFITGYDVLPGTPAIVHHVVAFVIDSTKMTRSGKTNGDILHDLAAKEPGKVGWTCFGGAGQGIEEEASPIVWAPGQGPVTFPESFGVRQRQSDTLVVQIHYNLADPATVGMSDSTTVRVRYVDSVARPMMFILPDGFLETLFTQKEPDSLRPGMPMISYSWQKTMAQMGLDMAPPLEIVGVMPHMHQRGRTSELHVQSGGQDQCLARVDNWNFHWQKFYFYKTPRPGLGADSQVKLTCTYDTSQDHDPVLPGWGTRNEMCLDTLMVVPRQM
jgi:hypothetical protein